MNDVLTLPTAKTVVTCYDLMGIMRLAGLNDLTEGKYETDHSLSRSNYLTAQQRQIDYLLDQVECRRNSRVLDIGCGNGTLVDRANQRGAQAVGITLSPSQATYGQRQHLDLRVMNYRDVPADWNSTFTGVVANGSLEHFAQISDATLQRTDKVYQEMFQIARRLLQGPGRKFATTAIHFREPAQFKAEEILKGPHALPRGSDEYHSALLAHTMGGWYPEPGQLERCAEGLFRLVHTEDGTRDYYLTSEFWLKTARLHLLCNPLIWFDLVRKLIRKPQAMWNTLRYMLIDQSWMWQFRGENPPMRLYRHTWEAI